MMKYLPLFVAFVCLSACGEEEGVAPTCDPALVKGTYRVTMTPLNGCPEIGSDLQPATSRDNLLADGCFVDDEDESEDQCSTTMALDCSDPDMQFLVLVSVTQTEAGSSMEGTVKLVSGTVTCIYDIAYVRQ